MKVLKKGVPWTKEVICTRKGYGGNGCGAKVLVGSNDIYFSTEGSPNVTLDGVSHVTFRCPCCKEETNIDFDMPISQVKGKRKKVRHDTPILSLSFLLRAFRK